MRSREVTCTRQRCPDSPASCTSFTGRIAASGNVKVGLAIPLNSTTTAAYARQYSQLSLTVPFLAEISIDDFVDQYRTLSKAAPSANLAAVVAEVIANVKSANMYDPTSDRMIIYGGVTGMDVWVLTNPSAQSTMRPTWTQLNTSATVENIPNSQQIETGQSVAAFCRERGSHHPIWMVPF
jgi:hypothetical protein